MSLTQWGPGDSATWPRYYGHSCDPRGGYEEESINDKKIQLLDTEYASTNPEALEDFFASLTADKELVLAFNNPDCSAIGKLLKDRFIDWSDEQAETEAVDWYWKGEE